MGASCVLWVMVVRQVLRVVGVLVVVAAIGGAVLGAAGGSTAKGRVVATGPAGGTAKAGREGTTGTSETTGSSAAQVNAARRALALQVAGQMLDAVRLPSDAQSLRSEPTDATELISRPIDQIYLNASVTATRFYRTDATPAAIMAAIRAGLPATVNGANTGSMGTDLNATFQYPMIDAGSLGLRQLVVATSGTANAGGSTVVRIDAEVQSIAERLPGQAIPAGARVVDITRPVKTSPLGIAPPNRGRVHTPAVGLTVTTPAQVTALARDVDALPFSGNLRGVAFSCPVFGTFGPTVTFTFRAKAGGPALASVRIEGATPTTVYPCLTSTLVVSGRKQPTLMQGGMLLKQAGVLLGVKLATRF
jgi:hypothetical protein